MSRGQKLAIAAFAILSVLFLSFVPVGGLGTYGRVTNSHYAFYFSGSDRFTVIDTSRLWMQFFALTVACGVAFYGSRNKD